MRSILVHVFKDPCMEARMQVALDLARRFDAHVTFIHAIPFDFGVPSDFYGAMAAEMVADFRRQEKEVRGEFEDRLLNEDVRWDWRTLDASAGLALTHFAPLADAIVVGARSILGRASMSSYVARDLAGKVRPPILIVPESRNTLRPDSPVAIAWNGSAEAGHAVQAAMPLLQVASEVHLLCVDEDRRRDREDLSADAAASYLARHGIESEIVTISHDKGDPAIAQKLLDASAHRNAEVMVAGAYGHSRFREWVLGGVTRDLLDDPPLPLMMSH